MQRVENISISRLLEIIMEQYKQYLDQVNADIPVTFRPVKASLTLDDLGRSVVVTYRVLRREPASMQGKPFSGEKFLTPRPVGQVTSDPAITHQDVHMHIHENLVEFSFASDSYSAASRQSDLFEDFMCLNRDVLRRNGYPEILFWQRAEDQMEEYNGKTVFYVRQQYYVRTKRLVVSVESVIRRIEIVLNQIQTGG